MLCRYPYLRHWIVYVYRASPFTTVFEHGSLTAEIYKPARIDFQQPHNRDEIYVVIAGTGQFYQGGNTVKFQPGDFLFVPAGTTHRFIDFTENFCT